MAGCVTAHWLRGCVCCDCVEESTDADHRHGQLCSQHHLRPNPTERKRCSCCAPLADTDAPPIHVQSRCARAPPRPCVGARRGCGVASACALGSGKGETRQHEPEVPAAVFCLKVPMAPRKRQKHFKQEGTGRPLKRADVYVQVLKVRAKRRNNS
ncbi:hypothetical protein TRVL_07427 [Trypanosoma vivax]|nr:hypothetical protein TRVL_07427 [Trypanosoma vivax]